MIGARRTHGLHRHRLYQTWYGILRRCEDPEDPSYPDYGARGISVCDRWHSVTNFVADNEALAIPGLTIDRIDNNGNYEPGNCRWATGFVQHNNTRANRFLEFDGKRLTITQWSRELGIPLTALRSRIKKGWGAEKALTEPVETRVPVHEGPLTHHGRTLTMTEWAKEIGVSHNCLSQRLRSGTPLSEALTMNKWRRGNGVDPMFRRDPVPTRNLVEGSMEARVFDAVFERHWNKPTQS